MTITPRKLNLFSLFKLPSAWLCGVRVKSIDAQQCTVHVTHRWINQNPFNSMFWAVQGMAAELSTGALVVGYIKDSNIQISMLVAQNKAVFTKKATGKIIFKCIDGSLIKDGIEKAIQTGEGQTVWMKSIGINSEGLEVSRFDFEWTVKVKRSKK
ncbi:DUF4442 domain-containing protein [Aquimarina sp. W85]|uniref:DUF4442 domain-containing protein n=1 Tax=Aquimarina rhodophyticola TaxID=3342246 RepID=UPI00366B1DAD